MNQKTVRLIFTILVSAVLITFIFSLVAPAVFAQYTELVYPDISKNNPNGPRPPNEVRELPNFIRYAFNLAIAIAGLAAFVSFVYGGVRYMTSAGNPGGISDAKDQIKASLLGLTLLLGSWLLLTTINPKLVVLKIDKGGGDRQGVILFAPGVPCKTGADNTKDRKEGEHYLRVKNSKADVTKFSGSERFPSVSSIQFLNSSEQIGIDLYSEYDYGPEPKGKLPIFHSQGSIAAGTCVDVNKDIGSIDVIWKVPGIYLFAGAGCTGDVQVYTGDTANFGDFDDDAKSLKIIPATTQISTPYTQEELEGLTPAEIEKIGELFHTSTAITNKLGVVLFENEGAQYDGAVYLGGEILYGQPVKAECVNITNACKTDQEPYCTSPIETQIVGKVSSLRVFNQYLLSDVPTGGQITQYKGAPSGDGVTLFGNYDFNEQDPGSRPAADQQIYCGPINATTAPASDLKIGKPLWVDANHLQNINFGATNTTYPGTLNCKELFLNHWGSSIRVDGDYIAVLFRGDGRVEVFRKDDNRLRENHIGDDSARYLLVIPVKQGQ